MSNILCLTAVILAVAATILGLVNAGGFDWKPLARGAAIITIVGVAWSAARKKAALKAQERKPASETRP
jgi:hypothetical protein